MRVAAAIVATLVLAVLLTVSRSTPDPSVATPPDRSDVTPLVETERSPSSPGTPRPSPTPAPVLSPSPPQPSVDDVYAAHGLLVPTAVVEQVGCPPPPAEPGSGNEGRPSWTPPRTVADDQLPEPAVADAWDSDVAPFTGKGMWLWQYQRAEGGSYARIVARAQAAGLDQLWVRVGDSRYGFYAAERLAQLVPLAHEAGLAVVGWGFPFLHDPAHDIAWSQEAMAWRGPHGRGLDGFSPDIEMETEKVELSAHRVEVYLSHVRASAGALPIAATVYPPVEWVVETDYPYETMAPYVDAFVPMAYWMCREPGELARQSVERLAELRPVHLIGQAFSNESHNRRVPPSTDETLRFLDVGVRSGAIGASLWVWDFIGDAQWGALASYPWHEAAVAASGSP